MNHKIALKLRSVLGQNRFNNRSRLIIPKKPEQSKLYIIAVIWMVINDFKASVKVKINLDYNFTFIVPALRRPYRQLFNCLQPFSRK